jgi:hypothetical protein
MSHPIWITQAGSLGSYPAGVHLTIQLQANPVLPANSVTYVFLSGNLPAGIVFNSSGLITGIPTTPLEDSTAFFVIRAIDNLGNIRDRTFSISISGILLPEFITQPGSLLTTLDSQWVELPILYTDPIENDPITVNVVQGQLPPGLEISTKGLIRGYPKPPIVNVNLGSVLTSATTVLNNRIVCLTTTGFRIGRPIVFTGNVLGGLVPGQTYFIKSIVDEFSITVSTTSGGPTLNLTNEVGYMNVTLPNISVGQPTTRTFSFAIRLENKTTTILENFSITVINQNAPGSEGGPNFPPNSRIPAIYNTRPPTFDIENETQDYGYYVLPVTGLTYPPNEPAFIGQFVSDNEFAFKIIGNDFDGNALEYIFNDLPLGLVGNSQTGWITGNPNIADNTISLFSFSVSVRKASNTTIESPTFTFSFRLASGIEGNIQWITPEYLGTIENSEISTLRVEAKTDIPLQYRLVDGAFPPNLTLLNDGEIAGVVAYQPNTTFTSKDSKTSYTFSIEAFSPLYPIVSSVQTFTIDVVQVYETPTDTLYIKCTPPNDNRNLLKTLLNNQDLIPNEMIYRPEDINFGKAKDVQYAHAYDIQSSNLDAYISAITKNHYWRNVTLGELKTAVARDNNGKIIYEVVYCTVVDNLVNPKGTSIGISITWPRNIRVGPEVVRTLYPNSMKNMRDRVATELGQEFNFRIYPKWMTSQQEDGSTLGFINAWVICYTKPGFSNIIKNNIETGWKDIFGDRIFLNAINFKIDRFIVDKSITYSYDNSLEPPTWTVLPSGTPVPDPIDSQDFYVIFPRKTILPGN